MKQTTPNRTGTQEASRSQRLKAATRDLHEKVDKRVTDADLFSDRKRYRSFLAFQHAFHADMDPIYSNPQLQRLIPDLPARNRLDLVRQDIIDIDGVPPSEPAGRELPDDMACALGWLYTAEGSNLGAAFLLKRVRALGLSESFGARHLAGHADGRGLHWRRFTGKLDAAALEPPQEARVIEGAKQAFMRVATLADQILYK